MAFVVRVMIFPFHFMFYCLLLDTNLVCTYFHYLVLLESAMLYVFLSFRIFWSLRIRSWGHAKTCITTIKFCNERLDNAHSIAVP